jgi:hypothetical protein
MPVPCHTSIMQYGIIISTRGEGERQASHCFNTLTALRHAHPLRPGHQTPAQIPSMVVKHAQHIMCSLGELHSWPCCEI